MLNNVFHNSTLVPIDFSPTSLTALDHAVAVAKIFGNEKPVVTLLHVIEGADFETISTPEQLYTADKDSLAVEGAINRLQKIIEKYAEAPVALRYMVASGKPYRKISELAGEIHADSIVMGTHGSGGLQVFAGSNASRVIQTAPCPVVVIREKGLEHGYKNIVLPLDLTKETKQKVNFAVKVARFYDATIHIVSMYEKDEFLKHRLENNLKQVESYLKDRDIKTTSTLLTTDGESFAKRTLQWAEGKNADLVVIMTKNEIGVTDYVFGTYAQQIVNRSSIPVMTIQPNPQLAGQIESNVGTAATAF